MDLQELSEELSLTPEEIEDMLSWALRIRKRLTPEGEPGKEAPPAAAAPRDPEPDPYPEGMGDEVEAEESDPLMMAIMNSGGALDGVAVLDIDEDEEVPDSIDLRDAIEGHPGRKPQDADPLPEDIMALGLESLDEEDGDPGR